MATINIFNTTVRGSLVMTGNTMLLNPESNNNYINPVPAPPSGSNVNSYLLNGSSGSITIPNTASVYDAKLVWAGVLGTSGGYSVLSSLNNAPITLTAPSGTRFNISPNIAWQQNFVITANVSAYVNIADVTTIVSPNPNGFYTVKTLPTLPSFFGGWLLYITYRDTNEPFRNINIWSLLSQINAGQPPVDIPVSGFMTPSAGNVTGRMILAAGNGQLQLLGENIFFGPSTTSLATLSGPSNPINNFFQGRINGNDGNLNTTGSFGNSNTPLGQSPVNGTRALWDITRVNASPGLTINQSTAIIRTTTSFDSYWISSVGLQVDVNAANLSPAIKSADNAFLDIGDTLTYTIAFGNSGLVESFDTIVTDTIPNGTTFVDGSVVVNNVSNPSATPQNGIVVGTVNAGERVTITFKVLVNTIPSPNPIPNSADIGFNYSNSSGTGIVHDNTGSNTVYTKINHVDVGSLKAVNKAFANVGDIITYTIPINAVGNTTAINIIFSDTIPSGTSYVAGSLLQNGITLPGNPNPPGVSLSNISAGKTTTLVFKVLVNTIPNPNPILNSATTIFTYTINPISIPNRVATSSSNTNIVNTQINNANLVNIIKSVDKAFANCGDTITYTIVIPNSGNVTAQNVVFKDTIPNGTVLLTNTIFINGVEQSGASPATGVTIPNIAPGTTITLTFQVQVIC